MKKKIIINGLNSKRRNQIIDRFIKRNHGSVIVEAAIYFPIVIAAVISVLYIAIGLYESVELQTSIHMALRQVAGDKAGTVIREEKAAAFDPIEQRSGLRKTIYITEEKTDTIDTIFRNELTTQEAGRYYVIDEVEMLRIIP